MRKRKEDLRGQGGVIIEQKGPNGWAIIGAGGLFGVALVIVALALWNLTAWAGPALIVLASGQAMMLTLTGVARIVEARGRAHAWQIGAAAREDIKRLWEEVE